MKKCSTLFMILLALSFSCLAQDSLQDIKAEKMQYKAIVTTDSGTRKGYLWMLSDSSITLACKKSMMNKSSTAGFFKIPVENISVLTVRNKRFPFAESVGGAILGFVLAAGVWANEDINEDGRLSFWELLFGAIDGVTAQGRNRRRIAMWVGIGGGAIGLVAGALSNDKLTVTFPLGNRHETYLNNKGLLRLFMQ